VVELVGIVHAVSASHVVNAIRRADAAGAPLVVLRLDTPGGLESSMREIVDELLRCKTPVVAFVGPSGAQAYSAGFIIAISADLVAMAPGTSTGAAHPVAGMGQMDEVMSKKVTSAMAAYIRSKAERRGRNVELAEKAVVDSRSFTEKEALQGNLIDIIANDVPDLLAKLDGREVTRFDGSKVTLHLKGERTFTVAMNWRQAVLSLVARPDVLFLLLLGTLAGLGTEIAHPGLVFPGIVGALCLILFLFASQILPVSGAGILLILLAIMLFAAEVKIHSYGLLTVGGITAMILGAMMLVDSDVAALRPHLEVLLSAVIAVAVWAMLLVRLVVAAQRRRPTTGVSAMVGQVGTADTALEPEGWIRVFGERWRAIADVSVAPGESVRVTAMDGLTLRVRKEV
jgi:membrane-bound serine protease (ClpP class)